jgi:long-chain acyl-CoA synthetase
MGNTITYKEFLWRVSQLASFLQNDLKLKGGDKIAIQLPNLIQMPVAIFAAFKAGLVVVNTNPLYTAAEMEHQFNDSGAKAVIILENFIDKLESVINNTSIENVICTRIGDMLAPVKGKIVDFVIKRVKKLVPEYKIEPYWLKDIFELDLKPTILPEMNLDTLAFLQYTGGTTGRSKGAMLTHGNVLANVDQISSVFGDQPLHEDDVIATPLPLYHIFSLSCNLLLGVRWGFRNLLIANPRDLKSYLGDLRKHPVTVMSGLNTLFNAMMRHKDFDKVNWKTYRVIVAGGVSLQDAIAQEFKTRTGVSIIEGYGLSETSPLLTCNPFYSVNPPGCIGLPIPSTDIAFFDDDQKIVPRGEIGEIGAKGPQVMQGYWNKPEETAATFKDGWFLTGDMGIMDEKGYVKIVDRKKEMIIVSGFNVYPNEVEGALMKHPSVLECAVVGIEDEVKGEKVVATFVVKENEETPSPKDLKEFCKESLTRYKIPSEYHTIVELPKSPVGKILRRCVKDEIKKGTTVKL